MSSIDESSVYNLKRRIASLPPISITVFEAQVRASGSGSEDGDKECSVCEQYYRSRRAWHAHLKSRNHIRNTAELDLESDESSSLSTLSLHSSEEDSCLDEDESNLDSTEEEQATPILLPGEELRLPSGKILGHRSRARPHRRRPNPNRTERSSSPHQQLLTEGDANTSPLPMVTMESKDRRLAMRNGTEMSMIGVPEQQQRALMAVEKKMESLASRKSNEYQAGVERGGNLQKRFRVKSIGKKAGGLEKRNG
jgi:pre-60S factor REI1